MREQIIEAVATYLPPPVTTVLVATLPIVELRGALPYALTLGNVPLLEAYLLAVAGNMLPIPFIILFLEPATRFLRRWKLGDRFVEWLFARTRRKGGKIEKYEALGLIMFVAIPLPVTGAWTGSLAGHIFGIKPIRTFFACLAGVCIAGVVVSVLTLGVKEVWTAVFG